jgi:type I restriction enzyme, S subunit
MKLGNLCDIVRGSSPRPQGDPRYYGGSIPRLMIADVTRDGVYVTPQIDSLTEEGSMKSRPMKKGDVIIAVSGDPGRACILNVDACIHDGFVGLRNESSIIIVAK